MRSGPVVQIAPEPQSPLQHATQPRAVASTPGQAGLVTSPRAVESLQIRSIYLAANPQLPNPIFDLFEPPKQGISADIEQVASGIANLFDHAHQQIGRWLESGLAFSTPALPASSPMFD